MQNYPSDGLGMYNSPRKQSIDLNSNAGGQFYSQGGF